MPQISPFNERQWQEKVRRRELRRYAWLISMLADEVQLTEDFSTDTPRKLAVLIKETADIIANCIPDVPPENLVDITDFLYIIAAHLRYVERARVMQTPWSLILTVEYFLKKQTSPKNNFIIRPTWAYNYSLIGDFWEFYKKMLGGWSWFPLDELKKKILHKDNETIFCISFPRLERTNCLLHANWGHEVGHIIAKKWIDSNFDKMWFEVQPDIKNRIEEYVK